MLQREGVWNDFSPKLITKLEQKVLSFGKKVRYKFDISNPDPDPEKRAANARIWPFVYTLGPVTFSIVDKDEDRPNTQKTKKVGLVLETEEQHGRTVATKFGRVRVNAREKGVKEFDLSKPEDVAMVMLIELHPKLAGGMFADKDKTQIISRIDEMAAATTARTERSERKKAMDTAELMSDAEIISFCDAMVWDSTDEIEILKNKVEELADTNPIFFNDLVKDKTIEYRSLVKRSMINNIITWNPAEGKFTYTSNSQVIAVVQVVEGKNEVIALADWLIAGGKSADEVYKKLKGMVENKKEAVA